MISVLILTRDEEANIAGCIESVAWSDDVHVFDSGSTDRTAEIARELGAAVTIRAFDNYAAQRNAALTSLPFRHDWIFILDADERAGAALGQEMLARAAASSPQVTAWKVLRKDHFLGHWLKHAQMSPWYIRLVRRGRAHYRREINEVLETTGEVMALDTPLNHYPFSRGISHWTAKHNTYSSMEARLIADGAPATEAKLRTAIFERDFHRRRIAQKAVFYRMPFRPLLKWIYLAIVRRGLLDGAPGFAYCTLQAWYEYMIVVKTREIRLAANDRGSRTR